MNNEKTKSALSVRKIAIIGILSSLSIVFTLTPLGYLLIPGLPVQITLMHLPVIIGGILEGAVAGGFIGLIFGLSSLYMAYSTPSPIAPFFMNPLVSVLPRILIGIVSHYAYRGLDKALGSKRVPVSAGISAFLGTTTNTVGVVGMIYLLYAKQALSALGLPESAGLIGFFAPFSLNYVSEVLTAVLLGVPAVIVIRKMRKN